MESRRLHPTNAGRGSSLIALGFEGSAIFWMAGSILFSIASFLFLFSALNWSFLSATLVGASPTILSFCLIIFLIRGKPDRYLDEFFEWQGLRLFQKLGYQPSQFFRTTTQAKFPASYD